jgi:hypothetical protein
MKRYGKSSLIKLVLLVGGAAAVAKLVGAKKSQWTGLSESEVRHKVETRMPDRVPEEKRTAVADKVVATMKTRGLLDEDAEAADASAADDTVAETVAEDADDQSSG